MIPQTNLKHVPVLSNEVLSFLDIKPEGKYLDGTCGLGGHSAQILSKLWFLVVLRGPGGAGAIPTRRGMKKHARGLIFMNFGWIYEGFVPIFDF